MNQEKLSLESASDKFIAELGGDCDSCNLNKESFIRGSKFREDELMAVIDECKEALNKIKEQVKIIRITKSGTTFVETESTIQACVTLASIEQKLKGIL